MFSINTDGSGYVLYYFAVGEGYNSQAGLTQVGSILYGTTEDGGGANFGTVFSINTDGSGINVLHSFAGGTSDGSNPHAGLTLVGSTLYGTTSFGGSANAGTVFSINADGSGYTLWDSFAGVPGGGSYPFAGLTLFGSTLYGTTETGGSSGGGTVFSLAINPPPVVAISPAGVTFTNAAAVAIGSTSTITDSDSANLTSLAVTLATPKAGDVLSDNVVGTSITSSYNATAGVLTLSGSDTLAHYQQVLRTVAYNNTTGSPGVAAETVSVVASDGINSSAPALATININVTTPPSSVSAVKLFYDNSQFNKNVEGVGTGTNDDKAIDTSKTAYLPGAGTANFSNVSAYTDGINGIMVDLATGGAHGNLNASDFTFRVGTNNSPSLWASAPTPSTISVRTGSPAAGNDRVELTWTDGSIKQEFLEVTVHADPNTGLSAPYTFFYGSVIANTGTGDSGSLAITSSTDENAARSHGGTATVTNIYDFNKDGFVNSSDENAARGNGATIKFIKIAANTPLAPGASPSMAPDLSVAPAVTSDATVVAASAGDTGLASGLSNLLHSLKVATLPPLRLDLLSNELKNVNLKSGVAATIFETLATADMKGLGRSIFVETAKIVDEMGLDNALLDSILVDLGLE